MAVLPDEVTPPEEERRPEVSRQLAFAMPRRLYTAPMKAPTKQMSMKATKAADSRVDLRRRRVASAHAAARTETMKRTLKRSRSACDTVGDIQLFVPDGVSYSM